MSKTAGFQAGFVRLGSNKGNARPVRLVQLGANIWACCYGMNVKSNTIYSMMRV